MTVRLHPRHGIHEPVAGTPARRPGSLRRTATVDMLRPEGLFGPLVLAGRGRDLLTDGAGAGQVVARASCEGMIDYLSGRTLTTLETDPERPGLQELLGVRVASGFRAALDAADPDLIGDHDLLYLLLDDFPVTALVSGHAIGAGIDRTGQPGGRPILPVMAGRPRFYGGLCAGFADGGTIMTGVERDGYPPTVTGPDAPSLTEPSDALAWHDMPSLPAHAMRRTRRIDVAEGAVEAVFRDSYVRPDGVETVIHEYTLEAVIEGDVVARCGARPRVLPWVECPVAAASAGRLAGQPLAGLRKHVRDTFTGVPTCTHLNDMLRALEDVPSLLAAL